MGGKHVNEDMLPKLGSMLTLPPGWKFEAKVLNKDLTIVPAGNVAHVITDDFQDVYEGCGFDATCVCYHGPRVAYDGERGVRGRICLERIRNTPNGFRCRSAKVPTSTWAGSCQQQAPCRKAG